MHETWRNLLARPIPKCHAPSRGAQGTLRFMTSLEKGFRDFAQFAAKLKGDEKSEAQTFLFLP